MADVAIIMPVWGQAPLLCESIDSVLAQKTSFEYRLFLMDDACPQQQTVDVCRRFARSHPDRIVYWRSPVNRGLAAMRNEGATLALEMFPDLLGVLSFDGDDRMHPEFIDRSVRALRDALAEHDDPAFRVGWVYEDPDHFGEDGLMLRTHGYSSLWSMAGCANCPTSLCNADVYRAGLRFREDMKHGSEDWQFWLACLDHGFRGVFRPHLGFRYRRRPGSMTVGAQSMADANRTDIRLSLPRVFHPDFYLAEEARELPRYVHCNEHLELRVRTHANDPGALVTLPEYLASLEQHARVPTASLPQFLVVAADAVLSSLNAAGLGDWALWRLSDKARGDGVAGLELKRSRSIRTRPARQAMQDASHPVIAIPSSLFFLMLTGRTSMAQLARQKRLQTVPLGLPDPPPDGSPKVLQALLDAAQPMVNRPDPQARRDFTAWRPFGLRYTDLAMDFFGTRTLLAHPDPGRDYLVCADADLLADPDVARDLADLAAGITGFAAAAPDLLVVGDTCPASLAAGFGRIHFAEAVDARTVRPETTGLVAPYGTIVDFGSAAMVPVLNQVRGYGRRMIGILPTRGAARSSLQENLQSCFKVFDRFVTPTPEDVARGQSSGLAQEQLASDVAEALAAGSAARSAGL